MKSRIFALLFPLGHAYADNAVILTPLPDPPVMTAADMALLADPGPAPLAPCPAAPAPARHDSQDAPVIVRPNADGVLDLTGIGETEDPGRISNPFRVRYHPQLQFREVPLAIASVLVGDRGEEPSAIINGELYSPGDRLEDMVVTAITADSVELRRGAILLNIPVQDQPTMLRLPR